MRGYRQLICSCMAWLVIGASLGAIAQETEQNSKPRSDSERLQSTLERLYPEVDFGETPVVPRHDASDEQEAEKANAVPMDSKSLQLNIFKTDAAHQHPTTRTLLSDQLLDEMLRSNELPLLGPQQAHQTERRLVVNIPDKATGTPQLEPAQLPPSAIPGNEGSYKKIDPKVVYINYANEKVLVKKLGLNPRRARSLIEFRETHGPFKTPRDLAQVAGISDLMVELWDERGLISCE